MVHISLLSLLLLVDTQRRLVLHMIQFISFTAMIRMTVLLQEYCKGCDFFKIQILMDLSRSANKLTPKRYLTLQLSTEFQVTKKIVSIIYQLVSILIKNLSKIVRKRNWKVNFYLLFIPFVETSSKAEQTNEISSLNGTSRESIIFTLRAIKPQNKMETWGDFGLYKNY